MRETNRPTVVVRQLRQALVRTSLGKFLLVVAFPLVKGHFTVHYMCCTRMAFRLGVRDPRVSPRMLAWG
jgi:hypothetical protein